MTRVLDVARRSLSAPAVYDLYQRLVGAPGMIERFVSDHICARPGQRLLDVGCGTGAVVPYLPEDVDLVGVDISQRYIAAATERYGERGTFLCADASDLAADLGAPFDTAYATGVLHHIPDAPSRKLIEGALARLKPGGRFVAIDPTLVDGQGWVSQRIVKADRGEHIRTPGEMAALMEGLKPRFEIVSDMLNIPFSQVITVIEKRVY